MVIFESIRARMPESPSSLEDSIPHVLTRALRTSAQLELSARDSRMPTWRAYAPSGEGWKSEALPADQWISCSLPSPEPSVGWNFMRTANTESLGWVPP